MTTTPILTRVDIRVQELARMALFYQSVLGLELIDSGAGSALLAATPDSPPLIALEESPHAPPPSREAARLFHLAILVPERRHLSHMLRRIMEEEYALDGASDHLVSQALYLSDPEGNGIELYWDRPSDQWERDEEGQVSMATLPLDLRDLLALTHHEPIESLPEQTMLGHVHLEVTDTTRASRFYQDVLGMRAKAQLQGALFVAFGDYHHHVGLNTWRRRTAPLLDGSLGLSAVHGNLDSPQQALDILNRARQAGVPTEESEGQLNLWDPDNIRWLWTY